MKVISKKLLAMILSVMLVISMTPGMVFAEGDDGSAEAPFTAVAGETALTEISMTEIGYTPYDKYDPETYAPLPGDPVTLYTITVPEGTESVELTFPEESLAYNYSRDGKTYLAGEYENNGKTGKQKVTVEIDSDGNGEADCIQVQTPYDENWSSMVLYAVTFDGMSLEKPEAAEVTEKDAEEILHNIAAAYSESGAAGQSQAPWIAADMMAYEKAFPDATNKLTEEQKQAMADESIAALDKEDLSVGDAAKYVLALVAMGYDPAQLTTSAGKALDAREKLEALTFDADGAVTEAASNAYTLPYVIIAYQQFGDVSDQLVRLKEAAVKTKDAWMDTTWGVDGITPMMLALAPLFNADEAAGAALDEAVKAVKGAQEKSGSIGGPFGTNAGSDGLAIAGFAALGTDPAALTYLGQPDTHSLLAGLVSQVNAAKDGFGNDFYTEQGFRGLIAASQAAGGKVYEIYDFSGQTLKPAAASKEKVSVTVQVLAHDGKTCENAVTYKNDPDKYYSLLKAESYTATLIKNEGTGRDALVEALEDSGVSYKEASNGYFQAIGDYAELGHGSNSGWLYLVDEKSGTTSVNNLTFEKDATLTFFYSDDYTKDYGSENWGTEDYYDDTKGHWAEDTINQVTDKGLMKGTADRTFSPDVTLSRAMFVTMLWRLDGEPAAGADESAGGQFKDVEEGSWYEEAVTWGVSNHIVNGTTDTTFSPNDSLTREQMATFLYRYTKYKGGSMSAPMIPADLFDDLDQISDYAGDSMPWAIAEGLINGVSGKKLAPKGTATRAQAATILMRYIEKHSL